MPSTLREVILHIVELCINVKFLCILQVYAEKYAEDQDAFFKDYAEAHAKLSNLGAKFDPPEVCKLAMHSLSI